MLGPAPTAVSFIVCRAYVLEPFVCRESTLRGLIRHLEERVFPIDIGPLCCFAELIGGQGRVKGEFTITGGNDSFPMLRTSAKTMFWDDDPGRAVSIMGKFKRVLIEEPGQYHARLFVKGEFIAERRFDVVMLMD